MWLSPVELDRAGSWAWRRSPTEGSLNSKLAALGVGTSLLLRGLRPFADSLRPQFPHR